MLDPGASGITVHQRRNCARVVFFPANGNLPVVITSVDHRPALGKGPDCESKGAESFTLYSLWHAINLSRKKRGGNIE
jgi:hypothetical protein